jgi:hypothetical protein
MILTSLCLNRTLTGLSFTNKINKKETNKQIHFSNCGYILFKFFNCEILNAFTFRNVVSYTYNQ